MCVFVAQVHSEVKTKLKKWIIAQEAEFLRKRYEGDGEIQRALLLKYIPLYRGFRGGLVGWINRVD